MSGERQSPSASERDIFLEAIEIQNAEARAAYLDKACGDDRVLRAAVEALLAHHRDDRFLETPAIAASETELFRKGMRGSEQAGDRIGRYKLLQEIGEGACGTVYMAEQEEPVRRRVALKIIKPGMDSKTVIARFEAERQALALMDHPNIAKVLDAGTTETGRPFFVMELVRGIKITDYCNQNKLSTRERLDLFIKVCQAIQHAHQKGIIHRDVKPSNILVTLHDGVPVPKVIDFGIAKATEQRLTDKTVFTAFEHFIGTPAYMSPEQAEMSGLDIDTRTDIYSLGVLLYEMLTGQTPFDATELVASGLDQMRRTIREREPERPSTRLSGMLDSEITTTAKCQRTDPAKLKSLLAGDLDWIVMKTLEKDRTRRYATANALSSDIQRYLNSEPVLARPPSSWYRLQKFARRNKLAVSAAGAFAGALVIGLAVSTWQFLEKTKAYRQVVDAEREQRRLREEAQRAQSTEAQLRRDAEKQSLAAAQKAYAADMNLVQQALTAHNLGRAQGLINRHRPTAGAVTERPEFDLRGWEWRYLWQLCQSDALFTLCQLSNEVSSLSVSHDGKWVAVGEAGNGAIVLWDVRARQEVARLTGDARGPFAFSPTAPILAFTAADRSERSSQRPGFQQRVRLWDTSARRIIAEIPINGFCRGLAFSRDGARLVTMVNDGQVSVWSVPDGVPLVQHGAGERRLGGPPFARGFGAGPVGNAFTATADLSLVAFAVSTETNRIMNAIRVMDVATGKEAWSAEAADEMVTSLAFSPDGSILASGAGFVESAIRLWDVAAGREIGRLEGHRGWVSALKFWNEGKTLASASGDQTIRLWDMVHRRPVVALRGHKLEVWSLAALPDNTTLISGSKDGSVYVWDINSMRRERTRVTIAGVGRSWRFAEDSKSIVSLDPQSRIVRWHGNDLQESDVLVELGRPVFDVVFSEGAKFAAAAMRFDGAIQIWDLEHGSLLREIASEDGRAFPVAFVGAPSRLIVRHDVRSGNEYSLREWDVATGREVRSWRIPKETGFRPTSFSPDGAWWIRIDEEGNGHLMDAATGAETVLALGMKQSGPVAFAPRSGYLAAVSGSGVGSLWRLNPPSKIAAIQGFLQGMHSAAFSPDQKRLAVGSNGNEAIKIWDVESGEELLTLEGDGSIFSTTAFSPDGNLLGSSNAQGVLHLWRAPSLSEIERAEAQTH